DLRLHLRRVRTLFLKSAPGLAFGTASQPFDRRIAAFRARERHTAILARATDTGVRREPTMAKGRPTLSSSGAPGTRSAEARSVERGEDSGTILGDGDRVLRMRAIRTV